MTTSVRRVGLTFVDHGQDVRLRHPQQDVDALAQITGRARCRLCHVERPAAELTFAEDAEEQPFGPVCMATAPGKLDCLHVRELRESLTDAAKAGGRFMLDGEETSYLARLLGWI